MKNKILSISLIIASLIVAYFCAKNFGAIYSNFFYTGSSWIGTEGGWNFIIGFPLSLIFFFVFILYKSVFKSKKSILWVISPIILFEMAVDIRHIYIPILLIIMAFGLNYFVRFIISKFKHPNPPMVIK